MSLAAHIRSTLELPAFVVDAYLADFTDDDLLVRPFAGVNHIAWQLGHLIRSERFHVEQVRPGRMPPLPAGFEERHAKETAALDDPDAFCTKAEYLEQMHAQRAGTLELLGEMSDAELAAPSPETVRYLGPTVGSVFAGEATHWMMHAGQWAVIRRTLGKPPLF